jgi:hypothetical protein
VPELRDLRLGDHPVACHLVTTDHVPDATATAAE